MSVRFSRLHTQNLKNITFKCYPVNGKLKTHLVLEHILRQGTLKTTLCDVTVTVNKRHLTCSIGTISLLQFTASLVTVPFCWTDCSILFDEFWWFSTSESSLEWSNRLSFPNPCLENSLFVSEVSSFMKISPVSKKQYNRIEQYSREIKLCCSLWKLIKIKQFKGTLCISVLSFNS